MPTIITDLHGTQDQYTWVVTATLLASTATTPIWGKFSDMVSKKMLVQLALVIFTVGSVLAGLSQSVAMLIGARAVQGLGLGGLQALVVIVIATMFSPRERGRYQGPMAGVMSIATVAGPLIGGLIVDTSWLGWRWTFFVGVPLAVIALFVIQRTLNLPFVRKNVSIDYMGALFIASGVSTLLIWVTLAGKNFDWASGVSFGLVALGVALLALAIFTETKAKDPIIPLRLFKDRTTALATLASVAVGIALFGGAVFLGQYFQIAPRLLADGGRTADAAHGHRIDGVLGGLRCTDHQVRPLEGLHPRRRDHDDGRVLPALDDRSRTPTWVCSGCSCSSSASHGSDHAEPGVGGAEHREPVRSGVGQFGGLVLPLARRRGRRLRPRRGPLQPRLQPDDQGSDGRRGDMTQAGGSGAGLSNLKELPGPIADIVRGAYGDATARIFLISGIVSLLSLAAIFFIKEVALRTFSADEQRRAEASGEDIDAELAEIVQGDPVLVDPVPAEPAEKSRR